jgi:hypothetical protein
MAVTAYWYVHGLSQAFGGETAGEAPLVDFLSDSIKVALTTNSYTPNQDTHDFYNDVTNEVTGTGYTAGGSELATKTLANTTNVVKFDAADTAWATSTITARYAVVYKDSGTSSTSPLLCWVNFGADVSSSAGTFQITWDSAGIATITATDATGYPA